MKWECTYCGLQRTGVHVSRMRAHWTCDMNMSKAGKGGPPCNASKCPDYLRESCIKEIENFNKDKETQVQRKRKATEEATARAKRMAVAHQSGQKQQKLRMQSTDHIEVDNLMFEFFAAENIPFRKINAPTFKKLVAAIKNAPYSYTTPNRQKLSGVILDRNYGTYEAERTSRLSMPAVRIYGTTAVTDGATIQKHPLVNVLVSMCLWPKAVLLNVHDCSDHVSQGFSKDAEFVSDLVKGDLRKYKQNQHVDLLITDGASDMTNLRSNIESLFPWMSTMWCICHVCNCILAAIGSIDEVKELIEKGKKIVTWFNETHFLSSLFRRVRTEHDVQLQFILGCDTRFGLFFLLLHRILKLKQVLKSCVADASYVASKFTDDEVKGIVDDETFWASVDSLVKMVWPVMMLLRMADGETPCLSKLYSLATSVGDRLRLHAGLDDALPFAGRSIVYVDYGV